MNSGKCCRGPAAPGSGFSGISPAPALRRNRRLSCAWRGNDDEGPGPGKHVGPGPGRSGRPPCRLGGLPRGQSGPPPPGVFAAREPKTGRVLALVGYRKGGETDPSLPLKAIYPAASLIKVVTAAAALEKGAISPEEEISYRGGIYRITRKGLHARGGRGVPTMTLEEAIAKSANSVFGKVGVHYVGSETLGEFMDKFGFGHRIPFGLPVEVSNGLVPSDEYHLARTAAGFGEVYVSPLHMAMIMSAIGSSGEMPRPILIESVEDQDGEPLYEAVPSKWRGAGGAARAGGRAPKEEED